MDRLKSTVGLLATLSFVAATASCGMAKPITSWQKQPNGVLVKLDQGNLRLQVCTPRIIHVSYSLTDTFPEQRVPTVIAHFTPVPFHLTTTEQTVTLATDQTQAQIDKKTGSVRFLDKSGKVILQETPDGRSLTPITLAGQTPTASFQSQQKFVLPADESIYGLGQHQDGIGASGPYKSIDYRGTTVTLQQDYIRNLAIPFLVSSLGYGVLWNNPASTTVNVGVGNDAAIPATQLYNDDGTPGGLTGHYYQGDNFETLVATHTDPQIDFNWSTPPTGLPHDHYSVRWTGSIQATKSGDYTLLATSDDGVRLWIDDKQVVDDWNARAVKTNQATVHFDANSRHKIRLEYYQDQFDATVHLTWRTSGESSGLTWTSEAADAIDYYFFYGPSSDQVIAGYRQATGQAPMPPKWALGFWQCKERYQSQQELLNIADGYRTRQEPIDNIVQDWFYWDPFPWGSHQFDPKRYPDPAAAFATLHDKYHLHLMISVWGKFTPGTPQYPDANYDALNAQGLLYPILGPPNPKDQFYDAFNPKARAMYWQQMRDQIFTKGVDAWWLDAAEPEVDLKKFRSVQTAAGLGTTVLNAWPLMHTTAVYEGQRAAAPDKRVFILTRSGYAGQQRNAATLWSSDIRASWDVFAHQVPMGLNVGLSGVPYWTTDIGGFFQGKFHGSSDPTYGELFTRWFQYGAFCPIFRVHGTQTDKEMWRFGPDTEKILLKYDNLRYRLMPYIYSQAWQVTNQGSTMMRALVMDFPNDQIARTTNDEFLFGPSLLVCPVVQQGAATRSVYLPSGANWTDFWTGQVFTGGTTITATAPIDTLPLYVRSGSIVPMGPFLQYTSEKPADTIELRVTRGANSAFTLYEDEDTNYNYEKGVYATIPIRWDDKAKTLTIGARQGQFPKMLTHRTFQIVWTNPGHGTGLDPATPDKIVTYDGKAITIKATK